MIRVRREENCENLYFAAENMCSNKICHYSSEFHRAGKLISCVCMHASFGKSHESENALITKSKRAEAGKLKREKFFNHWKTQTNLFQLEAPAKALPMSSFDIIVWSMLDIAFLLSPSRLIHCFPPLPLLVSCHHQIAFDIFRLLFLWDRRELLRKLQAVSIVDEKLAARYNVETRS